MKSGDSRRDSQTGRVRGGWRKYQTEDGQPYVVRRIKDYGKSFACTAGTDPDEGRKSELRLPGSTHKP